LVEAVSFTAVSGWLSNLLTHSLATALLIGVVPHLSWNLTGIVLPSLKALLVPLALIGCRTPLKALEP
jgi:hypothetical protein